MTPKEILDSVKSRFSELIVTDDAMLKELLLQALDTYQSKSGAFKILKIKEPASEISKPDDFSGLILIKDRTNRAVLVDVEDKIDLSDVSASRYPLKMYYFINLRGADHDKYIIPSEHVHLIADYLHVLIQIPDSRRVVRILSAAEMDTSHIPPESELQQRKRDLEERMTYEFILPTARA